MEKILYGIRIGEEDYQEEILTTNEEKIEDAKKWARANGFDRFRIAEFNMEEKPDFIGAIQGKKRNKKK